jgi:ABC-type multidrug transport system permease subunit
MPDLRAGDHLHAEHLRSVRLAWVGTGWLVSAAVTSLVAIGLAGLGLLGPDIEASSLWAVVAVAVGFWVGGFFTGIRVIEDAPILHGIGIGLASLVAWFLINLLATLIFGGLEWQGLSPTLSAGLLLLQVVAAVSGAWIGHRFARRGRTGVVE